MIPLTRVLHGQPRRHPDSRLVGLLLAFLVGCGGGSATFTPSGACGVDGRFAGAYPALEALLPTRFEDRAPASLDSGRHCSDKAIGSLITHDARGVEFAGATWDLGGGRGVSSALFSLPERDLPAGWIAEFYEIGARTAKRTENITASRQTFLGTVEAFRLDTLNDLSFQSVVTWQDGLVVRVVLVATPVSPGATRAAHDDLVTRVVAATVAVMGGT